MLTYSGTQPLGGIGFVAILLLIPAYGVEGSFMKKTRQTDWVGAALALASCTSVLLALSWGGGDYAWDSLETLLPLMIGLFGFFLLFVRVCNKCFSSHVYLKKKTRYGNGRLKTRNQQIQPAYLPLDDIRNWPKVPIIPVHLFVRRHVVSIWLVHAVTGLVFLCAFLICSVRPSC